MNIFKIRGTNRNKLVRLESIYRKGGEWIGTVGRVKMREE